MTLVLFAVVAAATVALVRRLIADDEHDASFEHWMFDVEGLRPVPPVHADVATAVGEWPIEVRQSAAGTTTSGRRIVAVDAEDGWWLLVERRGPTPERLDGLPVEIGTHGWTALRLTREEHVGSAGDAMRRLWTATQPWRTGVR